MQFTAAKIPQGQTKITFTLAGAGQVEFSAFTKQAKPSLTLSSKDPTRI
jgi:hypothetical protein